MHAARVAARSRGALAGHCNRRPLAGIDAPALSTVGGARAWLKARRHRNVPRTGGRVVYSVNWAPIERKSSGYTPRILTAKSTRSSGMQVARLDEGLIAACGGRSAAG